MANKIIQAQMKQRRDTKANWAAQNPVLLAGELGIVSDDPNLYKVGNGTTAWNDLPFRGFDGTLVHTTGDSETAVMSQKGVTEELEELAILSIGDYNDKLKENCRKLIAYSNPEQNRRAHSYIGHIHMGTSTGSTLFQGIYYAFGANSGAKFSIYLKALCSDGFYRDIQLFEDATYVVRSEMQFEGLDKMIELLQAELESNGVLIEDLQNTKIDKEADDYYPQLSVGLADNLAGKDTPVDSDITIRQSGGGAIADGVARVESIKGNSVVWNQLSTTAELNESYTTESLPIGASIVQGHKYAIIYESSNARLYLYSKIDGANKAITNSQDGKSWIFTSNYSATSEGSTSTGLWWFVLYLNNGTPYSAKNIRLIDLTQMFGAGNEPTTIEEFYKRILNPSSEYNAGEVVNTKVASIKSTGRNVWDEEWENGYYDANGQELDSPNMIRSKNYIPILPNTSYFFAVKTDNPTGISLNLYFYDANKNFISSTNKINIAYTTPSNAAYLRFRESTNYGKTYLNDICINLSDPTFNGQYEPYISREQSLAVINDAFPQGMHGIGSAQDEIRYNKATQKWEKVQRIGSVDMGTLNWSAFTTMNGLSRTSATISDFIGGQASEKSNILCAKFFTIIANTSMAGNEELGIFGYTNNRVFALFKESDYTDVATFKAEMSGVMLYYELAEPIVTELDFEGNLDYEVWNGGNEIAQTEELSTPVTTSAVYGFNAYAKIKENEGRITALEMAGGGSSEKLDFCIGTFFQEDTAAFFALCRENYDKGNHTLTQKYHGAIMLGDLEPRGFVGQFYGTSYGLDGDAEVFQCYGCGTLIEDGVPQEQAVTVVILRQAGVWSIMTISEMNAQGANLTNMTML